MTIDARSGSDLFSQIKKYVANIASAKTIAELEACGSVDEMVRAIAEEERFLRDFRARPLSKLPLVDRIRAVLVDYAVVTCKKCGRKWHEPLLEKVIIGQDGKARFPATERTTQWCSKCTPPKRQPVEGETFRPSRRVRRGKLVVPGGADRRGHADSLYFDGERFGLAEPVTLDEQLGQLARKSWAWQEQIRQNVESLDRERILSVAWIRENASPSEIQQLLHALDSLSVRQIARKFHLTEKQVRAGRTERVMRLLRTAAESRQAA